MNRLMLIARRIAHLACWPLFIASLPTGWPWVLKYLFPDPKDQPWLVTGGAMAVAIMLACGLSVLIDHISKKLQEEAGAAKMPLVVLLLLGVAAVVAAALHSACMAMYATGPDYDLRYLSLIIPLVGGAVVAVVATWSRIIPGLWLLLQYFGGAPLEQVKATAGRLKPRQTKEALQPTM